MILEEYESLYNTALQIKSTYETLEAQLEQTKQQKQNYTNQMQQKFQEMATYETAIDYMKKLIDALSRTHIDHLEKLLNSAVSTIFYDRDYRIEFEVSEYRNNNNLTIYLIETLEDGTEVKTDIQNNGFGVKTIVGFILQIYFILYHKQSPVLIIDEGFSALSTQYIEHFRQLIQSLTKEYGFIFILVNHDPRWSGLADKVYEMKEYEIQIDENNKKHYSKTIDETLIELDIPNEWNYEEIPKNEENDFYKYALKIYKDNDEQYAMLYVYNTKFGVCGTGRTSKNIVLNNGKEAIIGYYDGNKNWSDISFYKIHEYIAVINYGLVDTNAEDIIEVIKTINITNEQNEYSFCGTIIQIEENLFFVKPDEDEKIRKKADKIMIQKLKLDTNVKFEIGEKVKITYDGDVMTTHPAQILL